MKLYLAGPMTGVAGFNFPAFNAAADALHDAGYDVVNPADRGIVEGWEWQDYLRLALGRMLECDAVAQLDGWVGSRGARLETQVARELGMEATPLGVWLRRKPTGGGAE